MKKFPLFVLLLVQFPGLLFAQKKPLDQSTFTSWPDITWRIVSQDGKYLAFTITRPNKEVELTVQTIDGIWKKEMPGAKVGSFTADNHRIIFYTNRMDSLGILELGTNNIRYIPRISDFGVPPQGNGQWLIYRPKDTGTNLVLLNLATGVERIFPHIAEYRLNTDAKFLAMKEVIAKDSTSSTTVRWLTLSDGSCRIICQAYDASQLTFDGQGKRLVFLARNHADVQTACLQYFEPKMDSSRIVVDSSTPGMNGMVIMGDPHFDKNSNRIFFSIGNRQAINDNPAGPPKAEVTIEGMFDDSLQFKLYKKIAPFLAVIHLDLPKKVIRLQQEIDMNCYRDHNISDWVVTRANVIGNIGDYKWQVSAIPDIYLVSVRDGSRRLLKKRSLLIDLHISPSGKYVIWFDRQELQWFAHNIVKNITRNISSKVRGVIYGEDEHSNLPTDIDIAGWLENDSALLIYDRNDIWQVDPEGIKLPVNITDGYGARNKIILRYVEFNKEIPGLIHSSDTLLLSAFNLTNQYDGFFQLIVRTRALHELIMSPHCYTLRASPAGVHRLQPVIETNHAGTYIISRMSATEYPNLYSTRDFQDFTPLTHLSPQKKYNWYTTELVHWQQFDGSQGKGLLYKPENFDPHKKYPLIFYYYEGNIAALHAFIRPMLSTGPLNIPLFVNNGYLVFVPAIHYKTGHPGRSAYNAVVSAAMYLSKKPWIAPHRMGLQGHSFGGFETNYIVSHSSLFAAAVSASAVSNVISAYGELDHGLRFHEIGQARMGGTLWERPDLYIENSPVFKADKVTTPILIMHTKGDFRVPYSQGYQWYNELHRLGKKAWLLTYNGDHILENEEDKLDYSIRLTQFFDHYLKNSPAPQWMTQGVMPGTNDDGLELDTSGKQP